MYELSNWKRMCIEILKNLESETLRENQKTVAEIQPASKHVELHVRN